MVLVVVLVVVVVVVVDLPVPICFACAVRPVGRRSSTDSIGSTSKERLVAEAGVALIGQRPKPSQLSTM